MKATCSTFKTRIRREAMALYAPGLSCRAVAAALRLRHSPSPSQESVHQWARADGILRNKTRADELMNARRNGRDYDAIRARAPRLHSLMKWSVRAIALHFGVSRNVIKRIVARQDTPAQATWKRAWIAHHPDVEKRRADYARAAELRADGKTLAEIARTLGRPYSTVSAWFARDRRHSPVRGSRTSAERQGNAAVPV
jgi:transposase